jgi:PTS system mannitol-specific IIC component
VQKFGGYLAGMIMPNIGAFIAWGLITALFIPTGWWPNATLAALVGPIINYLLPVLIGYTGGRMVHGQRGAVIGAIATMGVIVGTDVPMFLGAMIIAPLSAFLLKKLDKAIEGKVPTGFEMLIDNFSLGILGGIMAILGRIGIGPVVEVLVKWLGSGVQALVNAHLLPLASIFVEPAKVLFLNNAINHGVLSPLGAAQSAAVGKSILFMVESNPGPGLGLLLAFMFFGPKSLRPTIPGAIIIQFFGGIHEIYFPYILMKPKMILATIAGGASGLFVGSALGAGLVSAASPGSIFAYFLVAPKGGLGPVLAAVVVAAAVSFAVAAALFGFGRGANAEAEAEAEAAAGTSETPTTAWTSPGTTGTFSVATATATRTINGRDVKRLVIACDAGMGSSVMVASAMKKKLASAGVEVTHTPVNGIPADAQLILCHSGLLDRAQAIAPRNAVIIPFDQYMGDPAFTRVENAIKNGETLES